MLLTRKFIGVVSYLQASTTPPISDYKTWRFYMKTFKDLIFEKHSVALSAGKTLDKYPELGFMKEMLDAKQAVIEFDNGRKLSVIFGQTFYSDGVSTYEAMEIDADNKPKGYLTSEEVSDYMKEIQTKD